MHFKNGWMAIAAFAASALAQNAPAAEDECLSVSSESTYFLTASATYGNLDIDGTLVIEAGVVLTLDGESGTCASGVHVIDGSVVLEGSGSTLRFIDTSQTVQGAGDIEGQNNAAKIEIESGISFTLMLDTAPNPDEPFDLEGTLQITGSGSFINDGKVHANATGVLKVNVASISGLGTWEASESSSATLRFEFPDSGCGGLTGRFVLKDNAEFEFYGDADIQTTNAVSTSQWCGTVDVDGGGSLTLDCDGSPTVISTDTQYSGGC
jgi:hypothetical protein